ncbi:MAG: DUF4845 domain-containing protein [Gammaproteobacteria bacterium]|nr:DUF4845 domain-containing protein [Gammaproteobacteria bacterium]
MGNRPTTTRGRQQGLTFWGYFAILVILGFFVLIGLKLTPIYLEYTRVAKQVESLKEQGGLESAAAVQVKKLLLRRFSIDDIDIPVDQIKIEKKEREVKLQIVWEKRTHMMGNVDALVSFKIDEEFTLK